MDDLVVDNELTATVVDDEGTDGTTAVSEGIADTLEEVALGDDIETLLDITALGHGDETVVITEVQDAVGLEDGTEHGLDNHGGRGVGDEAGLLLQLAGEEVDTEVTVLAGLGGDRDADDLARTALKDQDVADTDEVAGDGDGLASGAAVAGLDDANVLTGSSDLTGVRLLMLGVGEGVHDTVGGALNATAEGVVLAFVVVVTHFASGGGVTGSGLRNVYLGRGGVTSTGLNFTKVDVVFLVRVGLGLGNPVVRDVDGLRLGLVTVGGVYGLTITTVVRDVEVVRGRGTLTVVSFSEVDLTFDDFIVDLGTVFVVDRRLLVTGVAFTSKLNFRGVVGRGLVRGLELLVLLRVRFRVLLRLLLVLRVVFTNARTLFLNAKLDFFLSVNRSGKGSRTSSIFPFDARSTIEIDFSLYSSLSSFRDSVTPVRRREDTEGDWDTGVKVQIDGLLSVFSRMPFELSLNNSKD